MRKILIVFILSFILFFNVYAHDFKFELSEDIYSGTSLERIKSYYNPFTQRWEIMFNSGNVVYGKIYDRGFNELSSNSFGCSTNCHTSDYNYIIEDTKYWIALVNGDPLNTAYILKWNTTDFETLESEQRSNTVHDIIIPSVVNRYVDDDTGDPLILWDNLFNANRKDDLRYTIRNNLQNDDFDGDGLFNLPAGYHKPDDIQVVYCDNAYHVFVLKDGFITELIYDVQEQLLGDKFEFLDSGLGVGFTENITVKNFGVTSLEDTIYLATSGINNNQNVVNLQAIKCEYDDSIQLYSENIYQNYIHHLEEFDTKYVTNKQLHYRLNETGDDIKDYSVNDYEGELYGNVNQFQNSYFDTGIDFSGGGYIDVGDVLKFTKTDIFTLTAWVKTTYSGHQYIIEKHNVTDFGGYELGIKNGYPYLHKEEDNGDSDEAHSNISVNDGEYHFIVGVVSGDDNPNNWKFYVDGELTGTIVDLNEGVGNINNDDSLHISSVTNGFVGIIDEAMIFNKGLNSTEVYDLYNQTFDNVISKPFLTQDENDIYYLFYQNSYQNKLQVSYENPCFCSDWVSTGECEEDLEKQTRNCNPDLCDIEPETRYIFTEYCSKEYNRSQGIYDQEYETDVKCFECESEWKYFEDGETTASCEPQHFTIPTGATNITTNSTAISVLDNTDGCNKGTYDLTVCNPSYNCNEETFSCEYPVNYSQINNQDYSSGDIVTSKMTIRVDNICRCSRAIIGDKIKRFKILGQTCIKYNIPCKEEWYCLDENYKALRNIDCSVTNQTLCDYGCQNGECIGIGDEGSKYSPSNIFSNIINPNTTVKFAYSLFGSLAIGFLVMLFGKNSKVLGKNLGLFFIIGFGTAFTFFIIIGWIPAIIILFIVFIIFVGFVLPRLF